MIAGFSVTIGLVHVIAGQGTETSSKNAVSVMLDRILAEPQKYRDEEIMVEGVLVAPGKGFYRRFFLQGKEGTALEVTPWAPLEIYHPPPSQKERPTLKPMSYFVGRHLRLTGRLQKKGEGFIFKVSSAEEL